MNHPDPLPAQLRAAIPEIVSLWEARVREEVAPARHQPGPALRDHLPDYLEDVARSLESWQPAAEAAQEEFANEHGRQRATLVGYSLDQVLREYCLLRVTLLEVLEREGPLPLPARDCLLASVEEAMRHTAVEFVETQQEALRQADIRKNTFLYTLAHELRTPLSAIVNANYVLEQVGSAEPRAAKQRAIIGRQAGRVQRLVSDLTDASRVVQGKLDLQFERVDLRSIVQHAAESSEPFIDEAGHRLRCDLGQAPLYVLGDAGRLEQVISNLLNNAARYTEAGGEIDLRVAREGEYAVVRVTDTGRGIAPEMLPRVFDQYLQLDPQARRSEAGLGLGLTLVRYLVEAHQGIVEASSAGRDQGAEFTVRIPLASPGP